MLLKEFNNVSEVKNIDKGFKSDNLKDKNVIVAYEEEKIISIAFYHKPTLKELESYIVEYGECFKSYCDEENICDYNDWKEYVLNRCKEKIYLDYIESLEKNKGGAKAIIDYMEKKFNDIWLYSLCESEEFYDHMKWQSLGEYIYINKFKEGQIWC